MNNSVFKRQNLCLLVLVVGIILLFSVSSQLMAADLPKFELPYYENTGPYWSGGPHQWGVGPEVVFMDLYSGSGLDFSYGGEGFDIAAMAEGDIEYVGYPSNPENGLGLQVAVRHTIGGTIAVYGHLESIWPPLFEAYENGEDYHVLPLYTLGVAGDSGNTDNVHLHVELRDGTDVCCENGHLGGNPISWHSLVVGDYRIFDIRPNELGVEPTGTRQVAFNYDGVAVKVSDLPSELGPFGNNNFWYRDYDGEIREDVYTWLPSDFVCDGVEPDGTKNCEFSTPRDDVLFAGHGRFDVGGGVLVSNAVKPDDQPMPKVNGDLSGQEPMAPIVNTDPAYQEALVKIQQAADENVKVLSLADMSLTELPPEIGNLSNLNALWLQGNDLTSLPPEIVGLKNLTILSAADNMLAVFPQEILSLTNLKQLTLSGNYLVAIPPEIGNLSNLEILMLNHNQITSFPPGLDGFFDGLNMLRLDTNPKTEIPPEIVAQGTQAILEYVYSQPPFVHVGGDLSYSITTFPATTSVDVAYSIEFDAELRSSRIELSITPEEELRWGMMDGKTVAFVPYRSHWKSGVDYTIHIYTESLDGRIFDSDISLGVINP